MKKLKKGSIYCGECDGKGSITASFNNYKSITSMTCPRCHGDGQFDWIEQVIGKRKETNTTKSRVLSGFNYINKTHKVGK